MSQVPILVVFFAAAFTDNILQSTMLAPQLLVSSLVTERGHGTDCVRAPHNARTGLLLPGSLVRADRPLPEALARGRVLDRFRLREPAPI